MKWLVYLFAFYILLLSGIPCSADDGCCVEETTTTAHSSKSTGNTDHDAIPGCSPFFACGACHGVTIPDNTIDFFIEAPPAIKLRYFYRQQPLPDFPPSIWQPPKTV